MNKLGSTAETKKVGLVNLSNSMKNLRDSIRVMEEVQGMLAEQAGLGLAVAVSVHEINKITSKANIELSCSEGFSSPYI